MVLLLSARMLTKCGFDAVYAPLLSLFDGFTGDVSESMIVPDSAVRMLN